MVTNVKTYEILHWPPAAGISQGSFRCPDRPTTGNPTEILPNRLQRGVRLRHKRTAYLELLVGHRLPFGGGVFCPALNTCPTDAPVNFGFLPFRCALGRDRLFGAGHLVAAFFQQGDLQLRCVP